MGSTQLYSLTWGEFGTSLVSAVQLLRCHGDLVDVTLAAGGRSFPAHKIVLCAASPFLLNLLKSTPCQHPVVMLAGVTAPDLEALLEFVYRGEVSVDSNQLPSLLQAAHCLNIQGLAPGTISAEPEEITNVSSAHEALTRDVINSFLPIRRRKRPKHRNSSGPQSKWARQDGLSGDAENRPLDQQTSDAVPLTSEHDVLSIPDVPRKTEEGDTNTQPDDSSALLPTPGNAVSGGGKARGASDQPGMCPLCGAMLRQARNLRRHLLTSCKYRMMGLAGPGMAAVSSASSGVISASLSLPSISSSVPVPPGPLTIPTVTIPPQQLLLEASELQLQQRLTVLPPTHQPPVPPQIPSHQQTPTHQSQQQQSQQQQAHSSSASPNQPLGQACEHIVCKVSPLPSPMSSCSNLMSPSCSNMMSPQPAMVPPQ
ncbi:hypothetical protein R5R35_003141 [Gryllus longicercus]|uniref:BTB domain-containing protein n=1 Tax=Gryllus longicercus TaxID=2509291 RepID=A0AAN9Z6V1_9ORTH